MDTAQFERAKLLEQLGDPFTNYVVARFRQFCFIPTVVLQGLAKHSLSEDWGTDLFVLEKYLAVQVPWSIEQARYSHSESQFYTTAGNLQTRYGTPIYLVFERNNMEGRQPWCLRISAPNISAPELPEAPEIPGFPKLDLASEIVMSHDHILEDHMDRVEFLRDTPPVAQICAVAGAIRWSLFRQLQLPYWYYGRMNYLVPLYLRSRENIAEMPDLVAPIQVSSQNFHVRTVLEPKMPYANARVAVRRHDQLPPWLLDTWKDYSRTAASSQLEEPEAQAITAERGEDTTNVEKHC